MLVTDVFGCAGWHDCLSTDPYHEQYNNDRETEYPQKRTLQKVPQTRRQGKPRCCTRHFPFSIPAVFLKEQMGQQVQPRYIFTTRTTYTYHKTLGVWLNLKQVFSDSYWTWAWPRLSPATVDGSNYPTNNNK